MTTEPLQSGESGTGLARVWDGPRTKVARFNDEHWMVQVGWWLEPEARFLPITEPLTITGSASPVYAEDAD